MKLLFRIVSTLVCLCAVAIYFQQHRVLALTNTAIERVKHGYHAHIHHHHRPETTPVSVEKTARDPPEAEHHHLHHHHHQHHLFATDMSVPRAIRKVFLAVEQAEGAGARVRRSVGTPQLRNFSPFLMLDHFSIRPGAGFPDQYVSSTPRIPCRYDGAGKPSLLTRSENIAPTAVRRPSRTSSRVASTMRTSPATVGR